MFYCLRCDKVFTRKDNLFRHLKYAATCDPLILDIPKDTILSYYEKYLPLYIVKKENVYYTCEYCNKEIKYKPNYYAHKKYRCKKNIK